MKSTSSRRVSCRPSCNCLRRRAAQVSVSVSRWFWSRYRYVKKIPPSPAPCILLLVLSPLIRLLLLACVCFKSIQLEHIPAQPRLPTACLSFAHKCTFYRHTSMDLACGLTLAVFFRKNTSHRCHPPSVGHAEDNLTLAHASFSERVKKCMQELHTRETKVTAEK